MATVLTMTFRASKLEPWQEAVADRVVKLIKGRGMLQKALAEAIDIDPGLLSQMLTKKRPINIDAIVKIARALQMPVDELSTELADQIRGHAEVVTWPRGHERAWPFSTPWKVYKGLHTEAKLEIDKFMSERVLLAGQMNSQSKRAS